MHLIMIDKLTYNFACKLGIMLQITSSVPLQSNPPSKVFPFRYTLEGCFSQFLIQILANVEMFFFKQDNFWSFERGHVLPNQQSFFYFLIFFMNIIFPIWLK